MESCRPGEWKDGEHCQKVFSRIYRNFRRTRHSVPCSILMNTGAVSHKITTPVNFRLDTSEQEPGSELEEVGGVHAAVIIEIERVVIRRGTEEHASEGQEVGRVRVAVTVPVAKEPEDSHARGAGIGRRPGRRQSRRG